VEIIRCYIVTLDLFHSHYRNLPNSGFIMFLQLWPVIYSANKAGDGRSQSHGRKKK